MIQHYSVNKLDSFILYQVFLSLTVLLQFFIVPILPKTKIKFSFFYAIEHYEQSLKNDNDNNIA